MRKERGSVGPLVPSELEEEGVALPSRLDFVSETGYRESLAPRKSVLFSRRLSLI